MRIALEDALVSGIPIGPGQLGHCDRCGVCLRPNDRVEVLVVIDGSDIRPVITRCRGCARGEIDPETERPSLLARGRVDASVAANGRSELVLSGASVIDRTG